MPSLVEGLLELAKDEAQPQDIRIGALRRIQWSDITIEESLERADKALYSAKAEGRNCTQIWNQQKTPSQKQDKGK